MKKRILSIKVERLDDTDPDTSWLGEYSDKPKGDYSVDRAHDEDCQTQSTLVAQTIEQLERVIAYLDSQRRAVGNDSDNPLYYSLDDACDLIGVAQDELTECDCGRGQWNNREYRYFNTSGNYKGEPLEDIIKYTRQDYERVESLHRGVWGFIGITATAEITIGDTCQTITSGGLWGIESDSGADYLKEEEANQVAELKEQLYALGFSRRAIATAVKDSDLG